MRFLAKWLVLYHLLEHLQTQPAASAPAAVKRSRPEEEASTMTKKARTEEALPSTPMGLAQSGYYAANDPIKLPSVLSVSQLKGQAQTVLATVWEYLSGIDKDKQFARPVSISSLFCWHVGSATSATAMSLLLLLILHSSTGLLPVNCTFPCVPIVTTFP